MLRPRSRRRFMIETVGTALSLPTAAASVAELSAVLAAAPASSESFWQKVREQFPFREAKVPMNAANLCPSPRSVAQRVIELTKDIDVDCSFQNRAKFTSLLEASDGSVWFGSDCGVNRYDGVTWESFNTQIGGVSSMLKFRMAAYGSAIMESGGMMGPLGNGSPLFPERPGIA